MRFDHVTPRTREPAERDSVLSSAARYERFPIARVRGFAVWSELTGVAS